jgi:hypothetical protein
MILVDIGLHFHAEMTLAEADTFVLQHLQHLRTYVLIPPPLLGPAVLISSVVDVGSTSDGKRKRGRSRRTLTLCWTRSSNSRGSSPCRPSTLHQSVSNTAGSKYTSASGPPPVLSSVVVNSYDRYGFVGLLVFVRHDHH